MGYTLAAAQGLTAFAFGRLGLHRLEAACLPENEPSRRLLMRAGYELEGRASAYLKINGDWRDHLLFGRVADAA
jgi:ribosomal-protein-alanine N-acetyltransferase